MKNLKEILEASLLDIDTQLSVDDKDIDKKMYSIPKLEDFKRTRNEPGYKDYAVFFPCQDQLKKYNGYSWCPLRAAGLEFNIRQFHLENRCALTIYICPEGRRWASKFSTDIKGWKLDLKYKDKPVAYIKKVVISLIEHIAKNPNAFNAMLDYNVEIYKDIACKQSYDDGRQMRTKEFSELMKIR